MNVQNEYDNFKDLKKKKKKCETKRNKLNFESIWTCSKIVEKFCQTSFFYERKLSIYACVLFPISAGVGRTGTYIMIDSILRQAQNEQQTFDIAGYLHAIRDDRPHMVQTLVRNLFFFLGFRLICFGHLCLCPICSKGDVIYLWSGRSVTQFTEWYWLGLLGAVHICKHGYTWGSHLWEHGNTGPWPPYHHAAVVNCGQTS